jgi:hypothetical protein
MKDIWRGPVARTAGKYGEHAPMVAVCCNACRTCVTTNVLTFVFGALAGVGVMLGRFAQDFRAKSA